MADAPAGGAKWETFEIVIVVILLGGILMKLTGTNITPTSYTDTSSTSQGTSTSVSAPTPLPHEACGLTLTAPLSRSKVNGYVRVTGQVSGCAWIATPTVALYAQVINSQGLPVSEYTAIRPSVTSGTVVPFDGFVDFTTAPDHGTGYLILVPATPQQGTSTTVRIPITFTQ